MRVLILSADVAGGHDEAAKAIVHDLVESDPNVEIITTNGLKESGWVLHRIVRDFYHAQITYAPKSYLAVFNLLNYAFMRQFLRRILRLFWSRSLLRHIKSQNPDLVISTFHVVTAIVGGLRRTGQLRVPLAVSVTDVDPHPLWFDRGGDLHLVCVPNDMDRVSARDRKLAVRSMRPPIKEDFFAEVDAIAARKKFGIPLDKTVVLVSGGAWGVGDMESTVRPLVESSDAFCVVACGSNDNLQEHLSNKYPRDRVIALEFCHEMPELFAASDTLIHTAAGLTAFEALATGTPLVIYNPIPAHGERSAKALVADGFATWPKSLPELLECIDMIGSQHPNIVRQIECGKAIYSQPRASHLIAGLEAKVRRPRHAMGVPLRAARIVATLALTFTIGVGGFAMTDERPAFAASFKRTASHLSCSTKHRMAKIHWVARHKHQWKTKSC